MKLFTVLFLAISAFVSSALVAGDLPYQPYSETINEYHARICKDKPYKEMKICGNQVVAAINAELVRVNKKIIESLSSAQKNQLNEKNLLIKEQQNWIQFRDSLVATTYQNYIEGTIGGVKAQWATIDSSNSRVQELKRRYLSLFSSEISLNELVGTWRGLIKTKKVLVIPKDGKCSYESQQGNYLKEKISLVMSSLDGKKILDEWVHVEPIFFAGSSKLTLQFLHGEGAPKEIFLKD